MWRKPAHRRLSHRQVGLERVTDVLRPGHRAGGWLGCRAVRLPRGSNSTLHQHMPMFHMEHCVFAAFMSKGSTFLDCGRPCEKHRVHLRDRVGMEHPLRADVGCRNTLFNAAAQTGARFFRKAIFKQRACCNYRIELLEESTGGGIPRDHPRLPVIARRRARRRKSMAPAPGHSPSLASRTARISQRDFQDSSTF